MPHLYRFGPSLLCKIVLFTTLASAQSPVSADSVNVLIHRLGEKNPYVNGNAAETLSRIGTSAVPGLIAALATGNDTVRWSAVIALAKMGPVASPAVQALVSALSDSSGDVRWGTAIALGNIGPEARPAVPALVRALSEKDPDVRREAGRALEKIDPAVLEEGMRWQAVAETIDRLTPALMKEERVPGSAVVLIADRMVVWSNQYGVADVRSGAPVTDETMFEACSMSKPVFACIALKLVEEGRLDLDRPLVDYLELSSLRGQPGHERITARMVLSHTSGLPNWRRGEEERDGPLPVLFTPGTRFGYSGEGFAYLQKVVEQITGEPLEVHARRTLLDPLSMNRTSFAWRVDRDTLIAAGHDAEGRFREKTHYTHAHAAYTLYTSAADYARFLVSLLAPVPSSPHGLDRRSLDAMLSHQVSAAARDPIERPGRARGQDVFWGLGWGINTTASGEIIYHSGANGSGFRCYCQFNPARGSGIVIMTNGEGGGEFWARLIGRIGGF